MPSFIESPSYSGAAPTNTIVYTDAGEVFAAGNIQTDGTALAPTVISNTVKAATVGNVGAAHVGSTGTFSGTVIAATLNAATIGNSGATLTGTVSTAAQPNITSVGTLTGLSVTGNILPSANVTYNLGSSTARWKDLFLSGSTIDLGGTTISAPSGGGLSIATGPIYANTSIASTSSSTGALVVPNGGAGIAGNVYVGGAMTIAGNLTINGTTTTINNTTIETTEYVTTIYATSVNSATIGNSGAVLYGTLNSASASQPNITTLAGVTSIGASGVTTSVVGNLSVTGSGGNVTGVSTLFATTINAATIGNTSAVHVGSYGNITTINATNVNSATIGNISANHVGTGTYLTSLNASNLSSGTVPSAQISGSYTGITGVGTIATGTWQGSAIGASYVSTLNQNTTGSAATFTSTSQNSQFNSVGVGTAGSATAGEIRATNNITAYYSSDAQFKENVQDVPDALAIVTAIGSKLFDWTDAYIADHGGEDGYFVQKSDFGVIAQDVQRVFPQAIRTRPDGSLAVDYEKLATLSFGAIGQLLARVEALEAKQA
jgi:hypothetical protein